MPVPPLDPSLCTQAIERGLDILGGKSAEPLSENASMLMKAIEDVTGGQRPRYPAVFAAVGIEYFPNEDDWKCYVSRYERFFDIFEDSEVCAEFENYGWIVVEENGVKPSHSVLWAGALCNLGDGQGFDIGEFRNKVLEIAAKDVSAALAAPFSSDS